MLSMIVEDGETDLAGAGGEGEYACHDRGYFCIFPSALCEQFPVSVAVLVEGEVDGDDCSEKSRRGQKSADDEDRLQAESANVGYVGDVGITLERVAWTTFSQPVDQKSK